MNWKKYFNKTYISIAIHVILTAIIIYTLSLMVQKAPSIMKEVMTKVNWLLRVVQPIILGFVFAYLMDPLVNFFEQKYRKIKLGKIFKKLRAPRTWAAITSVIIMIIVLLGLGSLLVFSVTDQLRLANFDDIIKLGQAYMANIDEFYKSFIKRLDELNIHSSELEAYVSDATKFIVNIVVNFANSTLASITNISGYLTTIIFSFIIGIYFMIDGGMVMTFMKKVCRALLNEKANTKIRRMAHDLDDVFSGYIRGQLADAFFMMIIISIVLSVTGVKLSIVIGVLSGIGNLIPYFGPIVAYVSTTIVCLINGEVNTWIISMILLLIVQTIDGNVIGPKLLSKSIKIHPLVIIISLIFGSAIGGFLGMLLAVPIGAYIKLVFVRFIDHRLEQKEDKL